jgi:hypothetical protein
MTTTTPTTALTVRCPTARSVPRNGNPTARAAATAEVLKAIREVVAGARCGAHTVAAYAHGVQHNDGRIDDGATDPMFWGSAISLLTIDDEQGRPTDAGISSRAPRRADSLMCSSQHPIRPMGGRRDDRHNSGRQEWRVSRRSVRKAPQRCRKDHVGPKRRCVGFNLRRRGTTCLRR